MSLLTVRDATTGALELRVAETAAIAEALRPLGVRFERWPAKDIPAEASAEQVLEAYRPELDAFLGETGAGSADVIKLDPSHPQAAAMRAKFLNEHTHSEDEVRFFHAGSGNFILHVNGKIYDAFCTAGDLISVPANTLHWFDAGEAPSFTAVRVFTDTSGWVPHFTESGISERFPAITA